MNTKIGRMLLTKHTKKINHLNHRLQEIALELRKQTEINSYTELLLESAKENRREHAEQQEVINLVCLLDGMD